MQCLRKDFKIIAVFNVNTLIQLPKNYNIYRARRIFATLFTHDDDCTNVEIITITFLNSFIFTCTLFSISSKTLCLVTRLSMMMLVQQSLQEVEFCDQKFLLSITSVTKVLKRVLYASLGATVHLTRHFCTDCATVRYTAFLSLSFIKMNHGINYKIIHLRIKKLYRELYHLIQSLSPLHK